jgi:hypothetical protein
MSGLAKHLAQEGIDVNNFPPCEDILERDFLRAKLGSGPINLLAS